jgi:hypothetical protein
VFHIWGHDENFFEWSPASIVFTTYVAGWRPTDTLRLNRNSSCSPTRAAATGRRWASAGFRG